MRNTQSRLKALERAMRDAPCSECQHPGMISIEYERQSVLATRPRVPVSERPCCGRCGGEKPIRAVVFGIPDDEWDHPDWVWNRERDAEALEQGRR